MQGIDFTIHSRITQHVFHAYMFGTTKRSTGHTIKCGRSGDVHSWPTRNVAEQRCA